MAKFIKTHLLLWDKSLLNYCNLDSTIRYSHKTIFNYLLQKIKMQDDIYTLDNDLILIFKNNIIANEYIKHNFYSIKYSSKTKIFNMLKYMFFAPINSNFIVINFTYTGLLKDEIII